MFRRSRLAALALSAAALVPVGTASTAHAAPAARTAPVTLAASGPFRAGADLTVTATGVGPRAVVTGPRGMRAVLTPVKGANRVAGRVHVPAGLRASWIRLRVFGANERTAAVVVRAAKTAQPTRVTRSAQPAKPAAATNPSTAVTVAVRRSALLGLVRPEGARVTNVRVAADGRWASALVTPAGGASDPAQVLLARAGSRWDVRDLGTDGVGCGIVGQGTRARLGLVGAC